MDQEYIWISIHNKTRSKGHNELTHFDPEASYIRIYLDQHWLRQWPVPWRHQAIIWTNIGSLSIRRGDIHLRVILQEISQSPITKIIPANYLHKVSFISARGQWVRPEYRMIYCLATHENMLNVLSDHNHYNSCDAKLGLGKIKI